jgi:hypothetical protein
LKDEWGDLVRILFDFARLSAFCTTQLFSITPSDSVQHGSVGPGIGARRSDVAGGIRPRLTRLHIFWSFIAGLRDLATGSGSAGPPVRAADRWPLIFPIENCELPHIFPRAWSARLVDAEDFRGSVAGPAGTMVFEPDGVIFSACGRQRPSMARAKRIERAVSELPLAEPATPDDV